MIPNTSRKIGLWALAVLLVQTIMAWADGVESPYFKGGKLDAYYDRHDNGDFRVNSMFWSPGFKGGYGSIVPENDLRQTIHYYGGFVSPLLSRPELGNLVLGAQEITQGDSNQTEVQGEYRLASGIGVGAGFVDRKFSDQDIHWAKLSYRGDLWGDIRYILSTQWQHVQARDYPGGYLALYNPQLMATWGSDGEQWRASFGYVAPDEGADKLRPALEVFYVDNSIGQLDGAKDLWVTGSLGFRKGFLGHESRLGRAMGPTGVEMANPIGYLNPNFNRRLTAWEVGDLVNFRFIHTTLPNGMRVETLETAVYPTQLLAPGSWLDTLFVGVGNTSPNPGQDGVSGIFGYHQRIGHFESSIRVQHDFDRDDTALFVDLIHWL